jgi:membrane associated rhomboid family serine protease
MFSLFVFLACCLVFFLFPEALNILSFSGFNFLKGEIWRLFTFPFVHIDFFHLVSNIIALSIITMLALELGLETNLFVGIFLIAGIILALAGGFIFPVITLAGISLGVYAIFGSSLLKGKRLIPKYAFIGLIILSIGVSYFLTSEINFSELALIQSGFHFSGFLLGLGMFKIIKRKKRIFY